MTSFTVNSLHICWNLDVTFTLCQTRSHGAFRGSVPKFSCAQKFETYILIKTKILPLISFALQTWLQAYFMLAYTFKIVAFCQF